MSCFLPGYFSSKFKFLSYEKHVAILQNTHIPKKILIVTISKYYCFIVSPIHLQMVHTFSFDVVVYLEHHSY